MEIPCHPLLLVNLSFIMSEAPQITTWFQRTKRHLEFLWNVKKLNPWKFRKIVLHTLEITSPKTKSPGDST